MVIAKLCNESVFCLVIKEIDEIWKILVADPVIHGTTFI